MDDLNNQNENQSNNQNNEQNQNSQAQSSNVNQNSRTGVGSGQGAQNGQTQQYNNYQQNLNNSAKKKSKAPIIIVIILIVVLIFGCIFSGVAYFAYYIYKKGSSTYEQTKNIIANQLNELEEDDEIGNKIANTISNKVDEAKNTVSNELKTNNTTNSETNTGTQTSDDVPEAQSSTKESPLKIGTWGIASKYSGESREYEDIYVKPTKVIRGEEAKKAVQEFTDKSSFYKYQEPKEGLEWVVLDYDINFGNFTMPSYGADSRVDTSIKGVGNYSSVNYKGVTYILTTTNIGDSKSVKTKTTSGRVAFQMPIGCKDYIVQFGSYNETNAFYKGE